MPDENPYLEEVTPDTQDVPARIGVPVWRSRSGFHEKPLHPTIANEPGLWFASTPEAVAEMRSVVKRAVSQAVIARTTDEMTDAVLRALGFTDA